MIEEINTNNMISDIKGENSEATQFKKFDRTQWVKIEKIYEDPLTNVILETMRRLGNADFKVDEVANNLKTCGDEIYSKIRPILIEKNIIDKNIPITIKNKGQSKTANVKKNKKAGNKLTKEDIIRNNIMSNVNKNIDEMLKTFASKRFNATYGFNSQYAELKLITFIYAINYCITSKNQDASQCYELLIGIRKTLHNIKNMQYLSEIAYNDLLYSYKKLGKHCDFKYATMFEKYPRLCLMTNYDTVFPNMAIKAYDSQISLINQIKTHKTGLFCYKAMIGTGKTTVVVALAEYINALRTMEKATNRKNSAKKQPIQLIFTCSVEPVRHQVCRMAYNQQIPFGIAVIKNDNVKIINNFSCKSDDERLLIVADLDATIELLNKSNNYILFIDEPTVGADQRDHPITNAVSKIITLAPPTTILCSATLPEPEEIPNIINYLKSRYAHLNANYNVHSVCSKESLIGCEIIKSDGSILAPHNNCISCDELQTVTTNLKTKPFIDRLYTAPVVYKLCERMKKCGIENAIDLEEYFNDVTTLSQTNIQESAIKLLEILLEYKNDTLVETVCKPLEKINISNNCTKIYDSQICDNQNDETESNFTWGDDNTNTDTTTSEVVVDGAYDLKEIFTTQAHRYLGGCLVVVCDPLKFAYENSIELLKNCETSARIVDKYNASLQKFNQALQKLSSIKNEDERTKKEQEIKGDFHPTLNFPEHLRINTIEHLVKFAPNMKNVIDKNSLMCKYSLENIPQTFNVPDWVMLLLFAGIGIYSPYDKKLSSSYTEYILNMSADGKLAFLISDDNISYGANYPFSHTISDDELTAKHSIGTIFQLMGRAGRVGQSWVAYAHVGDKTATRIMNYIKGIETIGITEEASNMNMSFERIQKEIEIFNECKKKDLLPKENTNKPSIIKLSEVTPIKKNVKAVPIIPPEIKQNNNVSGSNNSNMHANNMNSANNTKESTAYVPPFRRQHNYETTTTTQNSNICSYRHGNNGNNNYGHRNGNSNGNINNNGNTGNTHGYKNRNTNANANTNTSKNATDKDGWKQVMRK